MIAPSGVGDNRVRLDLGVGALTQKVQVDRVVDDLCFRAQLTDERLPAPCRLGPGEDGHIESWGELAEEPALVQWSVEHLDAGVLEVGGVIALAHAVVGNERHGEAQVPQGQQELVHALGAGVVVR